MSFLSQRYGLSVQRFSVGSEGRRATAHSSACSSAPVAATTGTAEVIVTVGGEDDKVVLRSVESFDPVTHQWKNLACLPFAVSKHGLVVSGEETRPPRFALKRIGGLNGW